MELHEFFMLVPMPLVIMSGPEHLFTLTNLSYENLIGKSVLGKTVEQCFDQDEVGEFIPLLDKVYTSGIPFFGKELYFPQKNLMGFSEDHWVDVKYYPIFGNSGKITGVLGFISDATEVVKARKIIEKSEHFFRQLSVDLELESELKEIFVSTLSHDLRTPLTIAKLSANTLARNLIDIPALNKIALRISASMDKADKMIQDLLDASFIKAGEKLPIKISPCCMNTLVATVIDELSSIHENRFQVNAAETINGFWDGDGISRVLENLLLNAIKYGKDKAVVSIQLNIIDNTVVMSIHNEGEIIPPEDLAILFERFKRLKNTKMSEQKGWGLGLTLVKGIIEAHGGSVRVESQVKLGTTFFVELPLDSSGINN